MSERRPPPNWRPPSCIVGALRAFVCIGHAIEATCAMGMQLLISLSANQRKCASVDPFHYLYRASLRPPASNDGAPCVPGPCLSRPSRDPPSPSLRPPLVVEALWSARFPLTRAREGGNVSPCRRARARREGEGRQALSPHLENRILRTENRIEIEFRRFRWIG